MFSVSLFSFLSFFFLFLFPLFFVSPPLPTPLQFHFFSSFSIILFSISPPCSSFSSLPSLLSFFFFIQPPYPLLPPPLLVSSSKILLPFFPFQQNIHKVVEILECAVVSTVTCHTIQSIKSACNNLNVCML